MRAFGLAAALAAVLHTTPTVADELPDPDGSPGAGTTALALGATLLPGIVLHGSGHWVLGRHRAAARLLLLEGIGLGLMFAGISNLVVFNASRYVARSSAALIGVGSGFFVASSVGDVYGVAVPLDSRGEPLTRLPVAQAELGYLIVASPALPQHHLALTRLDLRWHGLHVQPTLWHALDHPAVRQRLQVGFRGYGPTAGDDAAKDGTFMQLDAAVTRHELLDAGAATLTFEVFAHGRLDLARVDPALTGMFGIAGAGIGLQRFSYTGVEAVDHESLLLMRSGFGVYLGDADGMNGEVTIYYDQRHDDFVGGLNDRAVGIPGHVGLAGHVFVSPELGLGAIVEVGANVVAGVSCLVRSRQ